MMRIWVDNRQKISEAIDGFFISIGQKLMNVFFQTGEVTLFFLRSLKLSLRKPYRFEEIVKHMEFIGNQSVLIISLTGAFTGMALSFQIYLGFLKVGATNLVGPTVALGITRELGPVLTGLIVAARAGGAMAARLGTMRVSEQIDALEVMGVDPRQYLVAPRLIAALISMPLLCGVFDFVALAGSNFLCIHVLGLDEAVFWDKIQLWLNPVDINEGLFKAAAFGMVFAAICTFKGFYCKGGAKGVGEATNGGVVNSMVLIIVANFFLSYFIRFLKNLGAMF